LGNKGITLNKLGRFQESLNCFNKLLKLNPNDKTGWHNKGLALKKLGKPEEALKCFDKALELDPEYEIAFKGKKEILEGKIE